MTRFVRCSLLAVCIIAGAFILVFLAAGWFFSTILYEKALNPVRTGPGNNVRIIAADPKSVVIEKLQPFNNEFRRAGTFELTWNGGAGRVSGILESDESRAKRVFSLIDGSLPAAGTQAVLDSLFAPRDTYPTPGFPAERIAFTSELGSFDAYRTPGGEKTWVILLHGNGMVVAEIRKIAESFRGLGYPTLAITYRNDPGQPRDPSGILQYGLTEWKELEGAVRYALAQGSEGVVVFGLSMGGGIALNFMYRSPLADRVRGLVLDAPMIDFGRAIDINAGKERLPLIGLPVPQALVNAAKRISELRYRVSWSEMNYLKNADALRAPMLLIHGIQDTIVPVGTSDELAAKRSDLVVSYMRSEGVEHCTSWNYDRETYERHLSDFMAHISMTD
jgi:alpha-beta hydrolase superfamily lysophospholipase